VGLDADDFASARDFVSGFEIGAISKQRVVAPELAATH
jgi:hypothetical protein